ncbi:hypothetical protein BaRGS_00023240 [Batillaria attramentaria]|uniref:Uncharacterized protein n=1 Tax=Batillaria attramentaria TaxID=370345 RepID=A0ABD0KEZ1_9CAEN
MQFKLIQQYGFACKRCVSYRGKWRSMSAQLNQQSEFCSSLGAATVTLLWRVSRSQDAVSTLLTGSKADEFLGLACSTVQSYLSAYCDDWPEEESSESCFILALCGTITKESKCRQPSEHLKLLQSVLADDSVTSRRCWTQWRKSLWRSWGSERNKQLKTLASELLVDLKAIHREQ